MSRDVTLLDIARSGLFQAAVAVAVVVWPGDAFIQAVLLHDGTIYRQLLHPEPAEIYFRAVMSLMPLLFGLAGSILLTRSRRTERALHQSEETLSQILQTTPDMVVVSRLRDGLLLYVNSAFAAMSKRPPAGALGKNAGELGLWVNPQRRDEAVKKIKETGVINDFEAEFRTKNGDSFPGSVSASLIELDGETCAVSVTRDITERKHAQMKLERAYHMQRALAEILHTSLQPITIEEALTRALDELLAVPNFNLEPDGAIFLTNEDQGTLELMAQRGLTGAVYCHSVAFSTCLCGRAAQNRETVFAGQVDERHDIGYEDMGPHGHYCVPILSGDHVLGVLTTYVAAGYIRNEEDERFLETAADTLALAIRNRRVSEALKTSYENLKAILNAMDSPIYIADMDTYEVLFINESSRKIFGDATGKICWQSVRAGQTKPCEFCTNDRLLSAEGKPLETRVRQYRNSLTGRWYECRDQAVTWFDGRTVRMEISTDITERRQDEEKIKYMANHDMLTGLPNRVLCLDRLEQALARCRRNGSIVAVLFIDLDNFKPINDTVGHTIGDQMLKQIGQKLLSCVRETDTVARFGGDEFVAVITDLTNREAPARVAEKMNTMLSEPIVLGSEEIVLGASIGVALFPEHAHTPDVLISLADKAMYEVKRETKRGYRYAAPTQMLTAQCARPKNPALN